MGFYDNSPGYKNPLSGRTPSWASNSAWDKSIGSIDWSGGLNANKGGAWDKSFGYNDPELTYLNLAKNKLFDKARQNREDQDTRGRYDGWRQSGGNAGAAYSGWSQSGGNEVASYGGEVLPGLGVYEPGKFAPIVLHAPQKKGMFGNIGGLAGGLGTAFGIFGPLGAPIGAAVGGIADQFI